MLQQHRTLHLASLAAMIAGLVFMAVDAAQAQSLTGGCRATVSGRALPSMTFDDPLVVTKGKSVRVNASVPASGRAATTNLNVKVGPVSNSYSFKGNRYNRNLKPPSWLFTIADGVVAFSGTASGNGFNCTGSGYVKIDGDGLLSLIGGTLLGAGGAAGVAGSAGPKQPPTRENPPPKLGREIVNLIKEIARDLAKDYGTSLGFLIALVLITFLLFGGPT
jgi:hypothetical protein